MNQNNLIKFQQRIELDLLSGCWLWKGKLSHGYGYFIGGRAHRISYEHWNGKIPEDKVIDHLCRNRNCVNPQHLEVVTQQENYIRGNTGKHNLEKTHCPKGHELTEDNVKLQGNKRACRICARERFRTHYRENITVFTEKNRLYREKMRNKLD